MRFKKINKLLVIIIIVMQVFLQMSLRVVEIQSRYIATTLTLVTHIEMMRSYLVTKCFCTLLGIYDIVF